MPTLKYLPRMRERVDPWSLRSVHLTLKCNGHDLGTASGFFWGHGSRIYLLTNWHVLSGRDPRTLQPLDEQYGALPDEVEYARFVDENDSNKRVISRVSLRDQYGKTAWLQHALGSKIDVAAMQIPAVEQSDFAETSVRSWVYTVNEAIGPSPERPATRQSWSYRHFSVGSDVFVVGFPLGLKPTGFFPIWKRASVATELDIDANDLPCFLIDTATRAGMSGSPVLHYTNEASGTEKVEIQRRPYFAGIYSGRHVGVKEIEAQLGIVWRTEVIPNILSSGVSGFDP